jgi:class 3 adenylate cyclase
MNLGGVYLEYLNKLDSALLMEKNAMRFFEQTGVTKYLPVVYEYLGDIYLKKGDIDSALFYYHNGVNSAIVQNFIAVGGRIYERLTGLYLLQKNKDSSLYYSKKFLQILNEKGIRDLGTAYQNLYESYKLNKQIDSAYKYQGLALIYKDSAYNKIIENLTGFQKLYLEDQIRIQELEKEKALSDARTRNYAFLAGLGVLLLIGLMFYRNFRQQQKANKVLADKNEMISQSHKRSDELLLNILPHEVAEELKLTGRCQAKTYSMVTIMFADFKDFTSVSEMVSAELLVDEINYCFSAFDLVLPKYRVEKIKTVGDAYICVGGMPTLNFTHATDVINAAIDIRNFMLERKKEKEAKGEIPFELRIGIHTGPVVAGIVGVKKYAYDIWGDTVNLAARMESSSEAGRINISGTT